MTRWLFLVHHVLYDTLFVLEIYNYQALLTLSTVKIIKINQELKEIN